MKKYIIGMAILLLVFSVVIIAADQKTDEGKSMAEQKKGKSEQKKIIGDAKDKVNLSDNEWKNILSEEEYKVLRECGTEPAFTGKYYNHKGKGTYVCAGCGNELFSSKTKYESGSGWPSFWNAVDSTKIKKITDTSYGMVRVEIKCGRCDAHLGHVFDDGPQPTGLRYCVNSVSLDFNPDSTETDADTNE